MLFPSRNVAFIPVFTTWVGLKRPWLLQHFTGRGRHSSALFPYSTGSIFYNSSLGKDEESFILSSSFAAHDFSDHRSFG